MLSFPYYDIDDFKRHQQFTNNNINNINNMNNMNDTTLSTLHSINTTTSTSTNIDEMTLLLLQQQQEQQEQQQQQTPPISLNPPIKIINENENTGDSTIFSLSSALDYAAAQQTNQTVLAARLVDSSKKNTAILLQSTPVIELDRIVTVCGSGKKISSFVPLSSCLSSSSASSGSSSYSGSSSLSSLLSSSPSSLSNSSSNSPRRRSSASTTTTPTTITTPIFDRNYSTSLPSSSSLLSLSSLSSSSSTSTSTSTSPPPSIPTRKSSLFFEDSEARLSSPTYYDISHFSISSNSMRVKKTRSTPKLKGFGAISITPASTPAATPVLTLDSECLETFTFPLSVSPPQFDHEFIPLQTRSFSGRYRRRGDSDMKKN